VDYVYASGLGLIAVLQAADWLEAPMRFFTFLGTAEFFFLVLPVIYWCIDAGLGMRIAFILLFSNAFNEIAKLTFHSPRPYWMSGQVKALAAEPTFGLPSGHAQLAAGVWGTIAANLHRLWAWIAASGIIFLIGLSRLYLGVHFPHDVLAGWLLGCLTLWAFLALSQPIARWVGGLSPLRQVLLILAVAATLLLAQALLVNSLPGYFLPPEWASSAARAGGRLPPQISMQGMLTTAGALIGLSLGVLWIGRRGGFQPSGPLWKRELCFIVGFVGVALLHFGLKAIFPAEDSLSGNSLRLVRYVALGLWISAGAPWAFGMLGLVGKPGN